MKYDYSNWTVFITENTKGSETVVEFGSMFFKELKYVHPSVEQKIGIEVHKPYIDKAVYHDCIKIHGDIRNYRDFIDSRDMDTVMLIDVLEHLELSDARTLLAQLQADFKKILLMVPEGIYPQAEDPHQLGADYWQTHKSSWTFNDVRALGFQDIRVVTDFHTHPKTGEKHGCLFAVWEKKF